MYYKTTIAFALLTLSGLASVRPASVFNHNMVVQRDRAVPVWGRANPGENVTVSFAGQSVSCVADVAGKWRAELSPMKADSTGRPFRINETVFNNVVVGEVWLCSGQSNMAMVMWGAPYVGQHGNRETNGYLEQVMTDEPSVRCATVPHDWSVCERELARRLDWQPVMHGKMSGVSAVAFHYALILHRALKVPVGVVVSAVGSTGIEAWIAPEGYRSVQGLRHLAETNLVSSVPVENPIPVLRNQPRALWNAMVYPLAPLAIRGVIWYQGERNRPMGIGYKDYLHALYNGWAKAFEIAELPFYLVQIAPYDYGMKPESASAAQWCDIWQAQMSFSHEIPNGGTAVIVDVGEHDNVHPGDKRTVSMRLAALAMNKTYGRKDIPCHAPELRFAMREGGAVRLSFGNVAKWTMHGAELPKFELAGSDGVFRLGKTKLMDGGIAVVSCEAVPDPVQVRYLWNWCWRGALKNEFGLPLGPFSVRVRTPEEAATSAYEEIWDRFVSPYGIVYDYRGEIPSPGDCEEGRPNAMGWFSPIENGPMFTGPFLRAMVRRAKRTGSAKDVEKCRKLVEGLLLCADVCGTPGMICRGVGTDGKCHYPLGSCDQTVPWFLGVGAYLSSGFGPDSLQDRAKRTMLRVADALEKVGWRLPCDGRFSNEYRGNLMSDSLMFRGSVHGLFVLRMLADVTGEEKWRKSYLAARDERYPGGEGETRLEICAYGYRFDLERAKRKFQMEPDQLWIYAGTTEALEELAEREDDAKAARLYRQGLANGAKWAVPFIEGYRQWDNRAERPFGFANWRQGYRWREQRTQKDAAEVANAANWEILGRRKSFERRYVTTPLAAAAICAMGDGDPDVIQRAISHYDYTTPNVSEFFYAVVAYESMKAHKKHMKGR